MSSLRTAPNINSLRGERAAELEQLRRTRREQLFKRTITQPITPYEQLEKELLQSTSPVTVLQQSKDIIDTATHALSSTNVPLDEQISAVRLIYTIVSMQNPDLLPFVHGALPFLTYHLGSPSPVLLQLTATTINAICQIAGDYRSKFMGYGVVSVIINQSQSTLNDITVYTSIIQLLSTLMMDNPDVINAVIQSPIPMQLVKLLPKTNNSKFIAAALMLLSLISSNAFFTTICSEDSEFLAYMATLVTTTTTTSLLAPALTIIGNYFTISTQSQHDVFVNPLVIDSIMRTMQRNKELVVDAVWVLGNIVSTAPYEVVERIVQSGCIPLLINLIESSQNEQLVLSVFVTINNVMMSENNGAYPFIHCCLELGFLDYLFDYFKVFQTVKYFELAISILEFLLNTVPDFVKMIQRIGGLDVLNDFNAVPCVNSFNRKLHYLID